MASTISTSTAIASSAARWRSLECPVEELSLDLCLACGQSFRWYSTTSTTTATSTAHASTDRASAGGVSDPGDGGDSPLVWTGVVGDLLVSLRRRDEHRIEWAVHLRRRASPGGDDDDDDDNDDMTVSALRDYLALDECSVADLYSQWCRADEKFRSVAGRLPGIRMLRQDPLETLFSFICSSNNHISRISGMVERLCSLFGDYLGTVDGRDFHRFPRLERLCGDGVEAKLRDAGFGYRAGYIAASAKMLLDEHEKGFLDALRAVPYPEARTQLMTLPGVGPKVADCVCLMALDKHDAVPVDTHVFRFAARDYMPRLAGRKSATPAVMKEVGDFFRELYGPYAGWAQSVLFSGELRKFASREKVDATEKSSTKSPTSSKAQTPSSVDRPPAAESTNKRSRSITSSSASQPSASRKRRKTR